MQPKDVQLLKALGHLPGVSLGDLERDSAFALASDVDREYLDSRCCWHPDKPDEEIAAVQDVGRLASQLNMDADFCDGLVKAHQRFHLAARYSRSWPVGCHDELESPLFDHRGRNAATFFIDRSTFPDHYTRAVQDSELRRIDATGVWRWSLEEILDLWSGKSMLDVAVALMVESFRLNGGAMIEVDTGPDGEHNIHIIAKKIPGSTIGLGWFNDGTCGDHVSQHIDSTWRPGLFGTSRLLTHESGHNWNLEHTFSGQSRHHGVMSYDAPNDGNFYGFSNGKAPHILPRDPALKQLKGYVKSLEPIPLKSADPPPPPPVDPVSEDVLVSRFNDRGATYELIRKGDPSHDDVLVWT